MRILFEPLVHLLSDTCRLSGGGLCNQTVLYAFFDAEDVLMTVIRLKVMR